VFPAAAPLLVLGVAVAAMAAAQQDWRTLGVAIAVATLGTGSAFAEPAGVWGIIALGGCVMFVGYAVYQVLQRRRQIVLV
jgi:hypothetical protein